MSIIKVSDLVFKYPQAKRNAVDGVSFVIEKGSYTAIIGSNGSGKSTLARLISGLENPQNGNIQINDGTILGIVFQSPKDQIVSTIVYRDTSFGPQNLALQDSEVELRTIECLNTVEMLDRATSGTSELSLGQTQKIALSGVMALHPDVLILDEAVSMLDPDSRKDIFGFLRYWHKNGNTIIHITHDIEAVKETDNLIAMDNGKVFFYGKTSSFLKSEDNVYRIQGPSLPIINKEILNKKNDKEVALKMDKVSYSHDNTHGISDVSFELYKGSVTALTGPSGAGKSTILELCAGLLDSKDGAIYTWNGEKPAIALQNAQAALFEPFACDDVAFGPKNYGLKGKALVDRVKTSMELANLPYNEFAERHTYGLSGGEQRRLSIAGIIALGTDIILFDEPTAGLDSKSKYEILTMFKKLAQQGKTILFTTHQKEEALFADREISIVKGEIIYDSCKKQSEQKLKQITCYEAAKVIKELLKTSGNLSGIYDVNKHPIQKMKPVFRILLFLLLFVLSLVFRNIFICLIAFVVCSIYGLLSGFKIKQQAIMIKKILPFLAFFVVLQLIFHAPLENEAYLLKLKWLVITKSKIIFCLASFIRTLASLICIGAGFKSLPDYDLVDGLKVLLKPLKYIKIPIHHFILIIELIFRFVPLLIEEAASIIKTQTVRGGMKNVKGKMAKIKALVPIIVPLIFQTLRKSQSLADAITVRYFK